MEKIYGMDKLVGLQLFWSGTPTFSSGTPTFCQMGVLNSCFQSPSESSGTYRHSSATVSASISIEHSRPHFALHDSLLQDRCLLEFIFPISNQALEPVAGDYCSCPKPCIPHLVIIVNKSYFNQINIYITYLLQLFLEVFELTQLTGQTGGQTCDNGGQCGGQMSQGAEKSHMSEVGIEPGPQDLKADTLPRRCKSRLPPQGSRSALYTYTYYIFPCFKLIRPRIYSEPRCNSGTYPTE